MGKHSAVEDLVIENNHVVPGGTITYWCGICSEEPAERDIEVELGEHWVPLKVGKDCLTRLEGQAKIDE